MGKVPRKPDPFLSALAALVTTLSLDGQRPYVKRLRVIEFFAPTRFEIPFGFQSRTKTFGIGKNAAHRLAEKIERSSATKHLIFGCAAGLSPELKVGECFIIRELSDGSTSNILEETWDLPSAGLLTSKHILKSSQEKSRAHQESKMELVDMEMFFVWTQLSSQARQRCIFARGVFDTQAEDLFSIRKLIQAPRDWLLYQKNMGQFLQLILGRQQ